MYSMDWYVSSDITMLDILLVLVLLIPTPAHFAIGKFETPFTTRVLWMTKRHQIMYNIAWTGKWAVISKC